MAAAQNLVITGIGGVCPIGIGREEIGQSLVERKSGIRSFAETEFPVPSGADVAQFEPKKYVRPRKNLKVMSRVIQLGFAAADLACIDAKLPDASPDPERFGVSLGTEMIAVDLVEIAPSFRACLEEDGKFDIDNWGPNFKKELQPLWMLKYLPNMPACHIGIAQDARGPNNTITQGDISSLIAVIEACRVLERGAADVMITGGTGTNIHPATLGQIRKRGMLSENPDPTSACRPFDAARNGLVAGEGAGSLVLETADSAKNRGVEPLAKVLGFAARHEIGRERVRQVEGKSIAAAIEAAMDDAGLTPDQIGHVNAHGMSTIEDDHAEAKAIRETLGDVPVTAPKSYFGNLGSGSGAMELIVSILAIRSGAVPPTLNYETPDPDCPIEVIAGAPLENRPPTALVLNHNVTGQAVAMIVAAADF